MKHLLKKRIYISAAIILICIGAGVGYGVYHHKLYYHFRAVDPGKVYRSGCLSAEGLEAVYKRTHFKTIIAVRSEMEVKENKNNWYKRETSFCKDHGLNFELFPLGAGCPPNPQQVKRFYNIISNPKMFPLLIHCEQGVIRTTMMVAIYRIVMMHENGQRVWDTVPKFGHTLTDYPQVKDFIVNFNLQKELSEAK